MNVSEGIPELTECPSGKLNLRPLYDHKYPWGPSVRATSEFCMIMGYNENVLP